MKVALTGGTGFLGRRVIGALRKAGYDVRALVRPAGVRTYAPESQEGVEWLEGSLEDEDALRALIDGVDAVVHSAYSRDQASFIPGNINGALRLLEGAAERRLPFVYTSSLSVYGSDPNLDPRGGRFRRDEDYPLWPVEVYGAHKAALEKLVIAVGASLGPPVSVLRLGWVLGVYEQWEKNAFAPMVDEALATGELRTSRGGYVIHVDDAASLLVRALTDERFFGRVFNTFDRWMDFRESAEVLSELLGRSVSAPCPASLPPRTPIENGRLTSLDIEFHTEALVRRSLAELVRRRKAEVEA